MSTEQFRVTAEYLASQCLSPTFPQRFFAKIQITDSCWLWTGGLGTGGYPHISRGAPFIGTLYGNRAMWILAFGPIPEGKDVCHDCPGGDNPTCVNPAHLWPGTPSENVSDSISKGRWGDRSGENHGRSKLTWTKVTAIRQIYAAGGCTLKELGAIHGVSFRTIWDIVKHRHWAVDPGTPGC